MLDDRVLIVDDSLTIRALVEELLANQGRCHAIAMAADVETARARIRDFHPTIITLDLNMPGLNGLAFLDELRGRPHAPVIVVSTATKEGSAAWDEALAKGAQACFDKSRIVSDAARFLRLIKKTAALKPRRAEALADSGAQAALAASSP